FGNPVSGTTVTFAAPGSGASGTFSNGTATISAATNASGQLSEAFTTGRASCSDRVTASVSGVAPPATFTLTNTAGAAASVSATSGSRQSATVNTAFASALLVTVNDAFGNPVPGATVTFAAPGSGASGTFSNGTATISATTNSSGQLSEAF